MGSTVRVSNLSLKATRQDILNFFSFSGEIQSIEMHSESETSQSALVTFKDRDSLETALLLSGATIVDQAVMISPVEETWSPSEHEVTNRDQKPESKAQAVVTSMLAKGFILGKDAMSKAKAFDEKHGFTANATATVANIDKKIGLTEKFQAGTAAVNEGVRSVDQKFQVSEKTKTAFSVAEQKVSSAGSALMKNKYVLTGATWVTGAFSKVAKAANDVGQRTKEKVEHGNTSVPGAVSTPTNASRGQLFVDESA